MTFQIGRYRKLIAAVIGLGILVALRAYEIEIPGLDRVIVDALVAGFTAMGVYQAPNDP